MFAPAARPGEKSLSRLIAGAEGALAVISVDTDVAAIDLAGANPRVPADFAGALPRRPGHHRGHSPGVAGQGPRRPDLLGALATLPRNDPAMGRAAAGIDTMRRPVPP